MKTQNSKKLIIISFMLMAFGMLCGLGYDTIQQDRRNKLNMFLECSKNEGDMGCDSCYFKVYGKHVDSYSLFYK
jgi:hypothetical protein